MILVAGGDSFVYGHELSDSYPNVNTHSRSTFPALLAKVKNLSYECVAHAGYSNSSIARRVMTKCQQISGRKAVIVVWTFPSRYEFRFAYDTEQKYSPWLSFSSWIFDEDITASKIISGSREIKDIMDNNIRAEKTGVKNFAKTFYEHVAGQEYWEIYSSLKEIVFLQNYLTVNQIPYLFTCADNVLFNNYTLNTKDEFVCELYEQINFDKFYFFPAGEKTNHTTSPRGFYQWAIENNYSVGCLHPLEKAHADAAMMIEEKFNELV